MKFNCRQNIPKLFALILALSSSNAFAQDRARGHFIVESIQQDSSNWPSVTTNVVGYNIYNNLRTSISMLSNSNFAQVCKSKLETSKATHRPIILEAPRFGSFPSSGESRWLTPSSVTFSFYNDGYRVCDFSDTPAGSVAQGQFKVHEAGWDISRSSSSLFMRGINVHNMRPTVALVAGFSSDITKCLGILALAKTTGRTVTIRAIADSNPWGTYSFFNSTDYFYPTVYGMSERTICSLTP